MKLFDHDWFRLHQRIILALLNAPIVGALLRHALWIDDYRHRIMLITPYSYVVNIGGDTYRTVIYSNPQHAQAMRQSFGWLWKILHWFDMRIANPFAPQWNLGFDEYSSQPDETNGYDSYMDYTNATTTNYGTAAVIRVGEPTGTSSFKFRGLIKFSDITTSIPSSAIIMSATLSLWTNTDQSSNARDYYIYRVLRNWVESEVTATRWSSGNNWTTIGCGSDGNDADLTNAWAVTNLANNIANGTEVQWALNATYFQSIVDGTYNNYGWLIKTLVDLDDSYQFESSSSATSSKRPKLVATWTVSSFFLMW